MGEVNSRVIRLLRLTSPALASAARCRSLKKATVERCACMYSVLGRLMCGRKEPGQAHLGGGVRRPLDLTTHTHVYIRLSASSSCPSSHPPSRHQSNIESGGGREPVWVRRCTGSMTVWTLGVAPHTPRLCPSDTVLALRPLPLHDSNQYR